MIGMHLRRILCATLLLLGGMLLQAQEVRSGIEIDYNHPRKYKVGGVRVEGNRYFNEHQILQLIGLQQGQEVTVPGEDITGIAISMSTLFFKM